MGSDQEAIKRIVEAFERSDWQEIDVRWGDLRVHLVADGDSKVSEATRAETADPSRREAEADVSADAPPEAPATAPSSLPEGALVVTSPSPGIFWRAPEPGAPPFVDVGTTVEPGSTLCIVEVMKLMSHVKAGMSGEVVAIYVENGVAVAKDEPLFALDPRGSTS